ncbi:MAG: lipopolysaccharide transport periplasmic protein LptA [Pseudomonadota bacterium]
MLNSNLKFLLGALVVSISVLLVPIHASAQSFGGAFKGMGDNDQPIQIEADRLEILDNENTAFLTGNVSVVQGTTILKAKQLTVYYLRSDQSDETNSGIRKIIASGKVAVRSQDNHATSDKAVVDMVTEIVTLTGNVFISQGNNIAKGCEVIVNLKTSVSEIKPCASSQGSNRVKLLLDPKSRKTN